MVGIQDLGGAGLSCATSELAQRGGRRHARPARPGAAARLVAGARGDLDVGVPGADDGGRRAGRRQAVPGDLRRSGTSRPTVVGEVDDAGRLTIEWHGEPVVDVPPRYGGARRPDLPPALRPAGMAGRAAGRRRPAWRGRPPGTSCARPCCGWSPRRTLRQVVGHRPVRPLRAGQHRARPAGGRRDGPRRRGLRSRRRGVHRRQRAVHAARPLRRCPARARRVLPQRGHLRRPPARGQRLPELRLPRGPGGDVAARARPPAGSPTAAGARDPGDRRQRQPLQPDRRDGDPARPRSSRCSG